MEKKISVFTIFTFLLFAVSTARIVFDPDVVVTHGVSKSSPESVAVADSTVLSNEKPKSDPDETTTKDRLPEYEKTQTFDVSTIDPTPRLNFARLRPINRHFFDRTTRIPLRFVRRHPCRKFETMIPRTKISYGNDVILSGKTYTLDTKSLGDQVPTKWLEFKNNYGRRHHHDNHLDRDEEFVPKYKFDREKMLHSSRHHKEKRENDGGFMKRIRKFLKHTFD